MENQLSKLGEGSNGVIEIIDAENRIGMVKSNQNYGVYYRIELETANL